jgi:cell division protein FtsZ
METGNYSFKPRVQTSPIIKVMGVGGGGTNTVNYIHSIGVKDVEFIVCNTDYQHLQKSPVETKVQLGAKLKEGLGAGGDPTNGFKAAEESRDEIINLLKDNTKMLFITSGMGGGTGTGAAPYIASIAREKDLDILTVGIVTVPFSFEGEKKKNKAIAGVEEMRKHCDVLLVIINDKIIDIYGKKVKLQEAFNFSNQILAMAVKSIAEIITVEFTQNMDFEDVKAVLKNSGTAVMGYATAEGDDRMLKVAEEAISSPLLNNRSIKGAKSVLVSIISGEEDIYPYELSEIAEYLQEQAGSHADLKFGTKIDPSLRPNEIRVTVIATGFEMDSEMNLKANDEPTVEELIAMEQKAAEAESLSAPSPQQVQQPYTYQAPPTQQPPVGQAPQQYQAPEPAFPSSFAPQTPPTQYPQGYSPGEQVVFQQESPIKVGGVPSPDGVIQPSMPSYIKSGYQEHEMQRAAQPSVATPDEVVIIRTSGQKELPMTQKEAASRIGDGIINPFPNAKSYEDTKLGVADRIGKLKALSGFSNNAQLERLEKEPAYMRKNNFNNTGTNPLSDDPKKKVGTLMSDNNEQIVGGNKFFNTKVD